MSDKEIRLVIFDIGRVILDFNHMITCGKLKTDLETTVPYFYSF